MSKSERNSNPELRRTKFQQWVRCVRTVPRKRGKSVLAGIFHALHEGRAPCISRQVSRSLVAQISNLSISAEIVAGRANFSERGVSGLPLPSTGRGNEGEGWCGGASQTWATTHHVPTAHPGPLPVEGRGRTVRRRLPFLLLRLCRAVLYFGSLSEWSCAPAGWKPAILQVGNLRYNRSVPRECETFVSGYVATFGFRLSDFFRPSHFGFRISI